MKLDAIYPVGAVIYGMRDFNPQSLFGGTWTRIKGRCLVFVNENDADFAAGKTGGAKSIALSTAQLPAHSHSPTYSAMPTTTVGNHTHTITSYIIGWGTACGYGTTSVSGLISSASHYHTVTFTGSIANTGSGAAHENRQPYLTCYMWYRAA